MNKRRSISFIRRVCTAVLVFFPIFGGCAQQHVISFSPNTDPSGANIIVGTYSKHELPFLRSSYNYDVTELDFERGKVILAKLTFFKEGYIPYEYPTYEIELNDNFRRGGWSDAYGRKVHSYHNIDTVTLEKDPTYRGSTSNPNKVYVTINSEPSGAKIYEDGKLVGTTPCPLYWSLDPKHYDFKKLSCTALTVFKEGYLPQEKRFEFDIDPEWRYMQGNKFEYAKVFFLRPDPEHRFASEVNIRGQQQYKARDYSGAKAEYEQALAAYNEALKEYNEAVAVSRARRSTRFAQPGDNFSRGMHGLLDALEPISLGDLETKLEMARQRLERAKARMNHSEW